MSKWRRKRKARVARSQLYRDKIISILETMSRDMYTRLLRHLLVFGSYQLNTSTGEITAGKDVEC